MQNNDVKVTFDFCQYDTFVTPPGQHCDNEDFHISTNDVTKSIFIGNNETSNYLKVGNNAITFGNIISIPNGLMLSTDSLRIYDILDTTYLNNNNKHLVLNASIFTVQCSQQTSLHFSGVDNCIISLDNDKNINFNTKIGIGLNIHPNKYLEVLSDIRIINSNNSNSHLDIYTDTTVLNDFACIKTSSIADPLMIQSHGGKVSLGLSSMPQKHLEILADMRIISSTNNLSHLDIETSNINDDICAVMNTSDYNESVMMQTHGGSVGIGISYVPRKHLEILSDMRIVNSTNILSYLDINTSSFSNTNRTTVTTSSRYEPLMIQTRGGKVGIGFDNRVPSETLEIEGSLKVVGSVVNGSDDRIKTNERYIKDASKTLLKLRPQIYTKNNNVKEEAGLIAQEVFYDAPELRHLVAIPSDADLDYITSNVIKTSNTPGKDPIYTGWGSHLAGVNYIELIPYLISYVKESHEEISNLKARIARLEKNT